MKEGYKFTPPTPEAGSEKIQEVRVLDLENGDWSEDHGATIAGIQQADQGQRVIIRFFENKIPPITVDRDDTIRIVKAS